MNIQTILGKACTLLMHGAIHWPTTADPSLWPVAVDYPIYHHNHMPHPATGMLAPIDLLLKTQISCTHFQDIHVWGCHYTCWTPNCRMGIIAQMETMFLQR